jgi:hypothetical protein
MLPGHWAAMRIFGRRAPIAVAALLVPVVAAAQPTASPIECAPQAALYQAEKGTKLWVLRQGRMVLAENPLRPLSQDEAVVLEVVVNGRRATAWGPDLQNLRQGGTPKSVEQEGREPIRWDEKGPPPAAIRVVAEDGRVLLGPMPFGGCEQAPAAKMVADKPPPRAARGKGGKAAAAAANDSPPAHLPQGALEGLSLPKAGTRR